MAFHHATLSDATSVASPTPFSPFSSACSTVTEAATVVSDGGADLGAFNSVFFALSQLQLQHSGHRGSPSSSSGHELQPSQHGIPLATNASSALATPSFRPHSMSPLSLDRSAFRDQAQRLTPSDKIAYNYVSDDVDPEPTPYVDDTKSDTTGGVTSSTSAAEDGDEESLGEAVSTTSPRSDAQSSEEKDEEILEFNPLKGWSLTTERHGKVYESDMPTLPSSMSSTDSPEQDQSPEALFNKLGTEDDDGPSLGEFSSAFEFFAVERAKLAKQLEAPQSGNGTPTSSPKKKGKKGVPVPITAQSKTLNPKKKSKGTDISAVRVVAHFNKGQGDRGKTLNPKGSLGQSPFSSDDVDSASNVKKPFRNGIIPRPPKQAYPNSASYQCGLADVSTASKTFTNSARRPANHRHTRSLPNNTQVAVGPADHLSADAVARIKSLARRLTFQFPRDASSLRRVVADPASGLGFGRHAAPTDDALVAGGFFEPVLGSVGVTVGTTHSSLPQEDHLYVFIDHSNVLVGYLEWLKKQPADIFADGKRPAKPRMSHTALVLLLARGRQSMRKVLVASSPLHQSLDEIASMGYQISVLQRVEIKEGAAGAPSQTPPQARQTKRGKKFQQRPLTNQNHVNSGSSTESDSGGQKVMLAPFGRNNQRITKHIRDSTSEDAVITPSSSSKAVSVPIAANVASGQVSTALSASPPGRPRFREEAVDELLQLKLLQTLLDAPSPPPPGSTIVLASGDAARSQFNPQGFLGCVRKAVERGWKVEVVGWDEGRSRSYGELAADVQRGAIGKDAGGSLSIISLDQWGLDLVEP